MENGAVGVIGVNVQRNMHGALRVVIGFATVQHLNTMENIARY